jgi:hypothetical protein
MSLFKSKIVVPSQEVFKASEVKETEMKKILTALKLMYTPKLKYIPQRLWVEAPLDIYGRALTNFSITSRLQSILPENTQCYIESCYITNFNGLTNPVRQFVGIGEVSVPSTNPTGPITAINATTMQIITDTTGYEYAYGDICTFSVIDSNGVQQNVMIFITIANATSFVGFFIAPSAQIAGPNVSTNGFPVFNTAINWAVQNVNFNVIGYDAFCSSFEEIANVNIELLGYTSAQSYDSAIGSSGKNNMAIPSTSIVNGTGNFSNIIGAVPCSNTYMSNGNTKLSYYDKCDYSSPSFSITDRNILNNNELNFRITYNQGGSAFQLPQPQALGAPMPFNCAKNYIFNSGSVMMPYNSQNVAGTWTPPAISTITLSSAQVYSDKSLIRFCLVFYALGGMDYIEN